MITTIEEAHRLILNLKICTVFDSARSDLPSLWEHVDLPEKQPGEKGWGRKVEAVWTWKNQLPADYPDEIFYGKIKGGLAVLMSVDYLREVHFPAAYRPIAQLKPLAWFIFDMVRAEPWETGDLRRAVIEDYGCSKSQFDTALKHLQISLNIVRANDPDADRDTWLTFQEQYPDIWARHVGDA